MGIDGQTPFSKRDAVQTRTPATCKPITKGGRAALQILRSEREYTGKASVLALGTFDGVHIGHAALIRCAHDIAADMGADCVVCTFDRHPLSVLHPERAPAQLTTLEEKCAKFAALGADYALVRAFTLELAAQSAEAYLAELVRNMRAAAVVVGENHRFGFHGQGDARLIGEMGAKMDFAAVIVPPVYDEGELVSSTLIRRLLAGGQRERAERLLSIQAPTGKRPSLP